MEGFTHEVILHLRLEEQRQVAQVKRKGTGMPIPARASVVNSPVWLSLDRQGLQRNRRLPNLIQPVLQLEKSPAITG